MDKIIECDCGISYHKSERQKHNHTKYHKLYLHSEKLEYSRIKLMLELNKHEDKELRHQLTSIEYLLNENERERKEFLN
jgi:hypothetical protein